MERERERPRISEEGRKQTLFSKLMSFVKVVRSGQTTWTTFKLSTTHISCHFHLSLSLSIILSPSLSLFICLSISLSFSLHFLSLSHSFNLSLFPLLVNFLSSYLVSLSHSLILTFSFSLSLKLSIFFCLSLFLSNYLLLSLYHHSNEFCEILLHDLRQHMFKDIF